MVDYKIACVIVTYNRKELLIRCLNAVAKQTLKPNAIYITDNASTDGTQDLIKKLGLYNTCVGNIEYKYILSDTNEGGAGGFYLGMKTAFDDKDYDALWVMDDDGEPENNCLELLANQLYKYNYIAPLVVSDKDHISTCFTYNHEPVDEFTKKMNIHNGVIENFSNPFNGVLYSSIYISKVGFPKKDMFIWGDEVNYRQRGYNLGFKDVTVVEARHYHPLGRKKFVYYRNETIAEVKSDWQLYCYLRNYWYNHIYVIKDLGNKSYYKYFVMAIKYWMYYKKYLKRNILLLLLDAYISAISKYFGGHYKYL